MNVTNRRNSTDADTPQPTHNTQQQQQPLLAYASCRQAATAAATTTTRPEQLQNLQHRQQQDVLVDNNDDQDQEQVVTSTSSDCLLPLAAEGEGEEVTLELDNLITSPARITSSTNNYEILTYNSDSLSREELVMPSTSDSCRLERERERTRTSARGETLPLNTKILHHSISNNRISKTNNEMVARDTTSTPVAEVGDSGGSNLDLNASTSTSSSEGAHENHKIILKLPKPTLAAPIESHGLLNFNEDDLRKVEPLKINLHNTHLHHHHHATHHTPKITIKPVVKEPLNSDTLMSSEECSSSAEDEVVSKLNASEPHIVPKLTIRSKNEELSTVVPKLTIKINDSTAANSAESSSCHATHPAANTPPLPKLTIKTGQDGHSESIITNISPASSTTSSSSSSCSSSSMSTNVQVATNSSATNIIPKLTIKPLQKFHETLNSSSSSSAAAIAATTAPADNEHPSIPKLCIKGNMICNELSPTMAVPEEATTSKIPKLTIKTGQEHAVIITQHNDNSHVLGGIPKLTIKTKSLDTQQQQQEDTSIAHLTNTESASNEKIPRITIKTNNLDSPNIISNKRSLMKSQLEATTPLSPKQAVPKLTITRQQNDMIVTNKHTLNNEEECLPAPIPKMTIKTQNKIETVPKLTIKNIASQQQRPCSRQESGPESDNEEETVALAVKTSPTAQHCKTVPKLTIKNLGSPQQKLTVVQEIAHHEPSKTIINPICVAAAGELLLGQDNLQQVSTPADNDVFVDLLNVDNGAGESSNSQEFCGFNDNTVDSSAKMVVITASDLTHIHDDTELRRNSDDMDIDEDLQNAHEPKIFKNDLHFETETEEISIELQNGKLLHPKISDIIDTVDLTSSPSRSCSPAQFDYNEDSNSAAGNLNNLAVNLAIPSTNILLERLQRETTVIQNTQQMKQLQQHQQQQAQTQSPPQLQMENSTSPIPPPLQPKPNVLSQIVPPSPASLKYPQLAERLMANGTSPDSGNNNNNNAINIATSTLVTSHNPTQKSVHSNEENIIDSIEILDTPEGSPRHSLDECPDNLHKEQQHITDKISMTLANLPNGLHYPSSPEICSFNNNNSNLKRHALSANLIAQINQNAHLEENNISDMAVTPSKQRRLNNEALNTKNSHLLVNNNNDLNDPQVLNSLEDINQMRMSGSASDILTVEPKDFNCLKQTTIPTTQHQRSRKQKHENLLPVAMEEVIENVPTHSNEDFDMTVTAAATATIASISAAGENNSTEPAILNATPVQKKRGRPKKSIVTNSLTNSDINVNTTPQTTTTPAQKDDADSKSRRVQLLRKRLAIDMVDADEPLRVLDELESVVTGAGEETMADSQERNLRAPLRTSRRSNTPTVTTLTENKMKQRIPSSLVLDNHTHSSNKRSLLKSNNENTLNHFLESNSSLSSSTVSNSSTAPLTQRTALEFSSMATQIDLTMSSSSSNSNGSTTNTVTTVEGTYSAKQPCLMMGNVMPPVLNLGSASSTSTSCVGLSGSGGIGGGGGGGGSSNNSMLPPTTILSSSDPLPDVVFKHNDFSSILATQQLRAPITLSIADNNLNESLDDDMADDASGPDNSGDDSASSSSLSTTPGRGRGRGRGSRGGRGRAYKAHRLGRNASAVSKAIAMSRPRGVGALKHTPDPERMKPLYSPSPSVFEEDTRMSADLSQSVLQTNCEPPQAPIKQPDFLNNEESQSSIISNTSILDPNNVTALQNGSSAKKPMKRKKMEVCVAEDAELGVSAIAEYDWPPPKGCCPSKNRDTFMIQEQVALYLGIKSFKRKYPDLPRRQIDMEERNYLQEKNLVSEKMCDLGITAVWASDILDIMYTDFYDKYEEYKDFVRQKHLREIEAKQKSLGLNVAGRGLQARDRAMLSTSKWNAYFNKVRKEERLSCLDLQTLTVNKPSPASAPMAAISYRPIAEAVARAAKAEKIPQPPTLMKEHVWEPLRSRDAFYPLSLVPGQFCERYYDYSAQELMEFPLNTVLKDASRVLPVKDDTTDTDSATETVDLINKTRNNAERLSIQRRVRRKRAKYARKQNTDEFKVPPLPGARSYSSTESSSEDSSSETDSNSSTCSSSSTDDISEDEHSPANCAVCQQPQNRNLKDIPELFVHCYTCRRKVHPSCIEMPHRMANRVRNYNWQCADCKCCIKCKRKQDQNKMLYCEQCDRGFHIYCLNIKAVPDGRWSCDRCSICMRCGATKPEGSSFLQPNGEKVKIRHRKLKWINEYRIDHVTKLREHCSMLCVPCGRTKTNKRAQINTHHNTNSTYLTSPGSSCGGASSPIQSPTAATTPTATPVISPTGATGGSTTTATNSNLVTAAATLTTSTANNSNINQTTSMQLTTTTSSITTATKSLESKDSISLTTNSLGLTDTATPQNIFTNTGSTSNVNATSSSSSTVTSQNSSTITTNNITLTTSTTIETASNMNTRLITTTTTTPAATMMTPSQAPASASVSTTSSSSTTSSGGAPPVVA